MSRHAFRTPPLVGLVGKKRAGKDTVAEILVREFGYVRVAFADPLKETALALDPLVKIEQDEEGPLAEAGFPAWRTGDRLNARVYRLGHIVEAVGWEVAKEVREVRRTLQRLGTAVRDVVDEGAWRDPALAKAAEIRESPPFESLQGVVRHTARPVVITDVRYPNEAEAIRAAGGTLVRIVRPGVESADSHASETALDDWPTNHVIPNDGTLADLQADARALGDTLEF